MRAITRCRATAVAPLIGAVVLALGLVVASPVAAGSQTNAPEGFGVVGSASLYSGVEYVKLAKARGPVVAHVAHLSPGAPVDLQVVNAYDRISTNPRELETTSSMCERTRCIVGVNGDFHKMGVPAGAVIVGGRMLHSPEPDRPQLTVLKNGGLVAGTFPWTGSLAGANGAPVAVAAVNAAPPANGVALFTPEHGPETEASSRLELVVRASEVGTLNQPRNVELVSIRPGGGAIPPDGAVFSADGSAGQQLRDLWNRRQASKPSAKLVISSPLDARVSLGVEPVVLKDGKRGSPWRDPNVINPSQPHTLVGWNKEGHVYLVAVDGRQAASEGMTMAEAADFLLGLGVTDAVSLDGGGGTTFVAGGSVWNRPSDNDPARPDRYVERGATNALVVIARPGAPAAAETPGPNGAERSDPKAVKPMSTPPEGTAGGSDGSRVGPTWFSGPVTVDGTTSLIGPAPDAVAGELPVGRSASLATGGPGSGWEATPTEAGGSPDAPPEDRSLVGEARTRQQNEAEPNSDDYQQSPLAAAADLTSPDPSRKTGGGGPGSLKTMLAGAALASALGLATRTRRERRNPAEVDVVVLAPVVNALDPPTEPEVEPEPEPVAVAPIELSPIDVPEAPVLFELTRLRGFHQLVVQDPARVTVRL